MAAYVNFIPRDIWLSAVFPAMDWASLRCLAQTCRGFRDATEKYFASRDYGHALALSALGALREKLWRNHAEHTTKKQSLCRRIENELAMVCVRVHGEGLLPAQDETVSPDDDDMPPLEDCGDAWITEAARGRTAAEMVAQYSERELARLILYIVSVRSKMWDRADEGAYWGLRILGLECARRVFYAPSPHDALLSTAKTRWQEAVAYLVLSARARQLCEDCQEGRIGGLKLMGKTALGQIKGYICREGFKDGAGCEFGVAAAGLILSSTNPGAERPCHYLELGCRAIASMDFSHRGDALREIMPTMLDLSLKGPAAGYDPVGSFVCGGVDESTLNFLELLMKVRSAARATADD